MFFCIFINLIPKTHVHRTYVGISNHFTHVPRYYLMVGTNWTIMEVCYFKLLSVPQNLITVCTCLDHMVFGLGVVFFLGCFYLKNL